jgi:hypothetical protein
MMMRLHSPGLKICDEMTFCWNVPGKCQKKILINFLVCEFFTVIKTRDRQGKTKIVFNDIH